MARVLHGSAATTAAVRGADTAWSSELDGFGEAPRDQKTHRQMETADFGGWSPAEPRQAKSTVPSVEEEAMIVAICRHMLLPLDDCL